MISGNAFGFSAFLNGHHIGSDQGANGADLVNASLVFPPDVVTNGTNVLTIVHDSAGVWISMLLGFLNIFIKSGLSQDWNADDEYKVCQTIPLELCLIVPSVHQTPRGIRKFILQGDGQFETWKLIGNLGGEDFPDKVRGPLNEGGLWLERIGATVNSASCSIAPNGTHIRGPLAWIRRLRLVYWVSFHRNHSSRHSSLPNKIQFEHS